MKKILILGGASVHVKLVETAKEMGLYTIVTDYLPDSPAKCIADKSYMINIMDVDAIVDMCKEEGVDAVLSTHLDPCQRCYREICHKLGVPCYGSEEQFYKMTDKHAFKKICVENNVDTIPEYSLEDIKNGNVQYPVFVKPVDSRGSRGQNVCRNEEETLLAVEAARKESSNGDVIIEKYMDGAAEIQVTYFFVDGEPYLIRTADSYSGSEQDGLEKVVVCSISPSKFTELYLETAHQKVANMFKNIGFKNGPIFMQGFFDEGKFFFFDPGLRFPGVDYDRIYKREFGIDIIEMMIYYALNGKFRETCLPDDLVNLGGKQVAILFPTIVAGEISRIIGKKEIENKSNVFSYLSRHEAGEKIEWTYDVNQRVAEIDVIANDYYELVKVIRWIQKTLRVENKEGQNMLYGEFDIINRVNG